MAIRGTVAVPSPPAKALTVARRLMRSDSALPT